MIAEAATAAATAAVAVVSALVVASAVIAAVEGVRVAVVVTPSLYSSFLTDVLAEKSRLKSN